MSPPAGRAPARPVAAWRSYPVIERVEYHLARARAWGRRTTRLGLALRGLVWLTGAGGLLLAMPAATLLSAAPGVAVMLALAAATWPGGRWVSLLVVAAIGLVTVRLISESAGAAPPLLVAGVATLLYLHHSSAALAAALRTDAVIPRSVLRYWAARAATVLAVSAALGLGVTVLPAPAGWSATGYLAVGTAAATLAAAALVWLSRRHRPQPRAEPRSMTGS